VWAWGGHFDRYWLVADATLRVGDGDDKLFCRAFSDISLLPGLTPRFCPPPPPVRHLSPWIPQLEGDFNLAPSLHEL